MNKLLTGGAIAALILAATPAQAQTYGTNAKDHDQALGSARYVEPEKQAEAETAAPMVEPAAGNGYSTRNNFTGPYLGAAVGYNFGNADVTDPAGPDGDADIQGWVAGGFLGYGHVFTSGGMSGFYLGGELGYDWSDAEGDVGGPSYHENRNFQATIRPGYVFNDNVLGYGIAGYSLADFEADANGESENFGGYVLGLGAEASTGTPFKARLEYTYSSYGDDDLGAINVDPSSNEIKLGILYQFQ